MGDDCGYIQMKTNDTYPPRPWLESRGLMLVPATKELAISGRYWLASYVPGADWSEMIGLPKLAIVPIQRRLL